MHAQTIEVYLFRHGETAWNVEGRVQGWTDVPLNGVGFAQAQTLGRHLAKLNIPLILSSPLMRAHQTATTVAQHTGSEIIVLEHLKEASFGKLEGKTRQEIIDTFGSSFWEAWRNVQSTDLDTRHAEGETKRELQIRVTTALEHYLQSYPHSRVAVATHGAAMRSFIHGIAGDMSQRLTISNCTLFLVHYNRAEARWIFRGEVKVVA